MDREAIAAVLEEIGLLLELLGENPFKTRAYDNAARVIRGLDRDVAELIARRELTKIRGIGSAIADKVATLVTTGLSLKKLGSIPFNTFNCPSKSVATIA